MESHHARVKRPRRHRNLAITLLLIPLSLLLLLVPDLA